MSSRCADYDYEVPPGAIAQQPAARREDARLFRVPRGAAAGGAPAAAWLGEGRVADLPAWLRPGDLLLLNEVRVRPARLSARRASGGRVSVLVLDVAPHGRAATVLLGARGTPLPGERLAVAGDAWRIAAALGEGRFAVEVAEGRDIPALLADAGRMPLPPYIERGAESDPRDALDRERYQTTFARGAPLAAAAPTAGLHLTPALLDALAARGIEVARLALHVGEGTFRPLRGATLDEHVMHAERYEVPEEAAAAFAAARAAGRRVVAVGTTVVRTLESAVAPDGRTLRAGPGETALFLRPGHRFRAVDALLTNFHQPLSTLLVLAAAFAGLETVRAAYAEAIARGARLFSYGDAMLLE